MTLDARTQMLGRNIFFDGDFRVTAAGSWLVVDGVEAVRLALYHRFLTSPGEFAARPNYGAGLRDLVYQPKTPGLRSTIQARVRDQALRDPRVEAVASAVVDFGDDGIQISLAVKLKGQPLTTLPFQFTKEAA